MLSENFFLMFLFFRIKKYLLGGDCRHSLTLQACKFLITACSHCNTQHRARKTLWQYAASKRMHFFIHRFIYVHITLRAGIIQIYQIQEMGHKSGLSSFSGIWVIFGIYKSFFFFLYFCKRPCVCQHREKTAFTLTASVNCASIRRT